MGVNPEFAISVTSARTRLEVPYSNVTASPAAIDAVGLAEQRRGGARERGVGRIDGGAEVERSSGRTSGRRSTNSTRTSPSPNRCKIEVRACGTAARPRGHGDRDHDRRDRCDGSPRPVAASPGPWLELQVRGDLRRLREGDGRGEAAELAFEVSHPEGTSSRSRSSARESLDFDGSGAEAEYRTRLGLAQVENEAADDDEALLLRKPVDGCEQQLVALVSEHGGLDGWPGISSPNLVGRVERECVPAACSAPAVSGLVRNDREQPGSKRLPATKPTETPVGLREGVVRRLLGVRGGSGEHVGRPEGKSLIHPHELLVGGQVSTLRAQHELRVVQLTGHHHRLVHRSAGSGFPSAADE